MTKSNRETPGSRSHTKGMRAPDKGGTHRSSRSDGDRRVRQAARFARVLKVLELIQSRGRWDAAALAVELDCTERTIHRDLKVLEFAGVPFYYDKHDACYRVRADYHFPVPSLTGDEIIGQSILTASAERLGLPSLQQARAVTRKLMTFSTDATEQLIRDAERLIVLLDLNAVDHRPQREMLHTAQQALLHGRRLSGEYKSPYERKSVDLQLEPYRLTLIKNVWYLIGRIPDDTEPRTYRMARFRTLSVTDVDAAIPPDFDLKEYFGNAWAVYRGSSSHTVTLWFDPATVAIVTETLWHPTQTMKRYRGKGIRSSREW